VPALLESWVSALFVPVLPWIATRAFPKIIESVAPFAMLLMPPLPNSRSV
jgi:hypothetical protein